MQTYSVTELLDWQRCCRLWNFRHGYRLEPIETNPTMLSGTVVHKTIELLLKDSSLRGQQGKLAADFLEELLGNSEKAEEYFQRFLPGIQRAIGKVPEWVWNTAWEVEQPVKVVLKNEEDFISVEVVGKPDLFTVDDNTISIVDFKTQGLDTTKRPTEALNDYMLWNPQIRYYGVILSRLYPNRLVRYRYVILPTQDRQAPKDDIWWVMTKEGLEQSTSELSALAFSMGEPKITASYQHACSFCTFAPLCTTLLTGGSISDMVRELYRERRHT